MRRLCVDDGLELADFFGDDCQAALPERSLRDVNAHGPRQGGSVCGAGAAQERVVAARECARVVEVERIQALPEELAKHVRVVVERPTGAVVVPFDGPHVGVQCRFGEAVAVRLALGLEHQGTEFVGRQFTGLALFEHARFEQVATGDVDDDLGGSLERRLEDFDFAVGIGVGECGVLGEGLAEDTGGFGEGHGCIAVERRLAGQVEVMVGVAELVGKGHDTADGWLVVHQDPRFVALQTHAKRTIDLTVARLGVDPAIADGALGECAHPRRVCAELFDNECRRFAEAPRAALGGDRGEQIVPGERCAGPQTAGFGLQIAAEQRERVVRSAQHCIEGGPIHAVVGQRDVECLGVSAPLCQGVDFALDGIERHGKGRRLGLPCSDFGIVGGAARLAVGVVRHGADGTHWLVALVVTHAELRCDGAVEPRPCAAATDIELRCECLGFGRHLMERAPAGFFEHEAMGLDIRRLTRQRCDVEAPGPGGQSGRQLTEAHHAAPELALLGLGDVIA